MKLGSNYLLAVAGVLAALTLTLALTTGASNVRADGNGSPAECLSTDPLVHNVDAADLGQSGDLISFTAPSGYIVVGACIKAGQLHTGPLTNGTYDGDGIATSISGGDACYVVAGVDTATATVTRVGTGSTCQELSHVDFVTEPLVTGEWCSPGYWRQTQHLDSWAATGYNTTDLYSTVFGSAPPLSKKGQTDGAPTDPTLLEVLENPQWYGGDAFNAVGDLLSDAHPDVDFDGTRVEDSCPLD